VGLGLIEGGWIADRSGEDVATSPAVGLGIAAAGAWTKYQPMRLPR
jgi:hypothetical protein